MRAMLPLLCVGLAISSPWVSRRAAVFGATSAMLAAPLAAEEPQPMVMLTEEEMAARVARKLELQRAAARGTAGSGNRGLDGSIRSDINPEASLNLRSRGIVENARASLAKQDELKTRTRAQKRDDLCEMLGRGC